MQYAHFLGIPFVYELDEDMKPVVSMQFLGDEETVKKAIGKLFFVYLNIFFTKAWHLNFLSTQPRWRPRARCRRRRRRLRRRHQRPQSRLLMRS